MIAEHAELTGSERATTILANWDSARGKFVKVFPNEYRRALIEMAVESGESGNQHVQKEVA